MKFNIFTLYKEAQTATNSFDEEKRKMRSVIMSIGAVVLLATSNLFGQMLTISFTIAQQDDPAYMLYKTGYNLILQSRYKDAQRKFEEVLKFYPKSSYLDDASYWYAYSLRYQDKKRAIDALKKHLTQFPKSRYRSDALEDLAELQARVQQSMVVRADTLRGNRLRVNVPEITVDTPTPDRRIYHDWDFAPGEELAVGIFLGEMQDEMEWGSLWPWFSPKKNLDENTRLKISALRGIAAEKDSESFRTVRDILLDRSENLQLREQALRLFAGYRRFDLLPTLKDVAKTDPEHRLRLGAIYYICKYDRDKEGATDALMEIYHSTPKDSVRLKKRLLYSIAKTRSEKGMDFLVSIANSNEDYKLRESALYWLGKYGGGKGKKALYEILKRK